MRLCHFSHEIIGLGPILYLFNLFIEIGFHTAQAGLRLNRVAENDPKLLILIFLPPPSKY